MDDIKLSEELARILENLSDEKREEIYDLLTTPVEPPTPPVEKPGVFTITCHKCNHTGPAPEFVKFDFTYYSEETGYDISGYVQCPVCDDWWDFVE